jgi:hypothetical protein
MKSRRFETAVWAGCLVLFLVAGPGCATVQRQVDRARDWWEKEQGKDEPGESDDAVAFSALRWNRGGEDFSRAVRDDSVTITGAAIHAGGTPTLHYSAEGLTVWPKRDAGDNIRHVWALFFDESGDGVYERGGKFDWGRSNAAPRPLQHIGGSAGQRYQNWDGYPRPGTPWAGVITDKTGQRRSNVVRGVWP